MRFNRSFARRISKSAALVMAMGLALPVLAEFDPLRKSVGDVATKLNAMERKPFDWTLVSSLSDWTNGSAPTAQSTDGKVVLFVTYSDWYRPAARAFAIATKAAETYGKDGLVVVAVHNAEGWKDAPKPAAPAGSTMLLAVDTKGEFRKGLLSIQDPNFYLVDRAGQLRFANIANESVDDAVKFLVAEKREDAGSLNQREADAKRAKQMQEAKTGSLNNQNDLLRNIPELPFTQPSEQAYRDAKWPVLPTEQNSSETPTAKKVTLPSAGWAPAQPELKGRAVVLYFWNPNLVNSYDQVQTYADFLQRQHQRDLAVVGVLTDLQALGASNTLENLTPEEKAKKTLTPESALQRMKEFQSARKYEHAMVVDLPGSVLKSINSSNQILMPFMAVLSSDGNARWWGFAGSPAARGAMDRVLEVDPGVQARRKVEAEYLKATKPEGAAATAPATPEKK